MWSSQLGLFCVAVPADRVATSDLLKALSQAVASSVGKPEQVGACRASSGHAVVGAAQHGAGCVARMAHTCMPEPTPAIVLA